MKERGACIALIFALVMIVFCAGVRIADASEQNGAYGMVADRNENADSEDVSDAVKSQILSEFDFSELDSSLKEMFPREKVTFSKVVSVLISGDISKIREISVQFLKDLIAYDFFYNRKTIVYIILAALVAAVFRNFADAFQSRQISDISFYVIYMLLITLCLTSFQTSVSGLEEKLDQLNVFVRSLAPAYFMAVSFASGSAAALVFYNLILFLIYIVELVIVHILLPAVNVYVMICMLGSLIEEAFLSELAGLIRKAVTWALHGLLACVAGINIIQGLLAPAIDSVKRSTITRTAESVPWIGDIMGGTAEVLTGTVILIKNGIGMAGAVIALVICAVPLLQMIITALIYKLAAALVQPVSDKRIISCIRGVSEGYELLVRILLTAAALFLITIAVTASFTS